MKYKKVLWSILLIIIVLASLFVLLNAGQFNKRSKFSNSDEKENTQNQLNIVVSNFVSYDFLRAIIGDNSNVNLKFIIGAGKDSHGYVPTAQDLISIQNSNLFVYVGGSLEEWSSKILEAIDISKTETICISDYIDKIEEKEIDGAETTKEEHNEHKEGAFDEHIWSSPENAIKIVNILENAISKIDPSNSEIYSTNAKNYIEQIKRVDAEIQNIVDNKVRNRLLFGDRMPMQYFIEYYNLDVSAAFDGCSTEAEPSTQTIAYLIDVAKRDNIPVILYIELNDGKVAKTMANEVGNGCTAMQIQTLHNVSKDDFENGATWVSLMERNIDVLKKALQ